MNKEEVVTTLVMSLVSVLVLIGFTVAWYRNDFAYAAVIALDMEAKELESIIIALEPGGQDIMDLAKNDTPGDEYAEIGLAELNNIENEKLAPGAFGEVAFYITPLDEQISICSVVPTIHIKQGVSSSWYTGEEVVGATTEELYEITQRHIVFFSDEAMTQKIDATTPFEVAWAEDERKTEKEVILYWKWYYEYPFTETEKEELDDAEEQNKIDEYDEEDTMIGNNISSMKFHFAFSAK